MKSIRIHLGWLAAVVLQSGAAWADGDKQASMPLLPKYKQECSACHLAYPPQFLPAASWQRQMQNLSKHYGSDASLDAATVRELSLWLNANAASGKRARQEPPQDRITQSAWFVREHEEVSAATWKLPAVKSAANCAACHTQAESQGTFHERHIRIPR